MRVRAVDPKLNVLVPTFRQVLDLDPKCKYSTSDLIPVIIQVPVLIYLLLLLYNVQHYMKSSHGLFKP
jgi:hypothetical protein